MSKTDTAKKIIKIITKNPNDLIGIHFLKRFLDNKITVKGKNHKLMFFFQKALMKNKFVENVNQIWDNVKINGDTSEIFANTFDWNATDEGYAFWKTIDEHYFKTFYKEVEDGMEYNQSYQKLLALYQQLLEEQEQKEIEITIADLSKKIVNSTSKVEIFV